MRILGKLAESLLRRWGDYYIYGSLAERFIKLRLILWMEKVCRKKQQQTMFNRSHIRIRRDAQTHILGCCWLRLRETARGTGNQKTLKMQESKCRANFVLARAQRRPKRSVTALPCRAFWSKLSQSRFSISPCFDPQAHADKNGEIWSHNNHKNIEYLTSRNVARTECSFFVFSLYFKNPTSDNLALYRPRSPTPLRP